MKKLILLAVFIAATSTANAQKAKSEAEVKEAVSNLWGDKANNRPTQNGTLKKANPYEEWRKRNINLEEITISLGGYESSTDAQKRDSFSAENSLSEAYISKARSTQDVINILAMNLGRFYRTATGYNVSAIQISQVADEASIRFSALTIAQNQRIIEQNDEIIKLLKIQASKK